MLLFGLITIIINQKGKVDKTALKWLKNFANCKPKL